MKTLSVLIGLQASGKSTFCRTVLNKVSRINLDELKTRHREKVAYEALLEVGNDIVIDNTNPTIEDRERYIPKAKALGYKIVGYYFESKIAECQKRNALRDENSRVPTLAIAGTSKKLQPPNFEEGFDELFYVSMRDNDFEIKPWNETPKTLTFSDLSREMKAYEKECDWVLDRRNYVIVRLDGRNFSRLTKETCDFQAPFDERFHIMMRKTLEALVDCGFRVAFAYSQSDEISLLLDNRQDMFGRRARKILSILAGTASAAFSLQLGQMAIFDSRILSLPTKKAVKKYFSWRWHDCKRNCLNAYAYWTLRNQGVDANDATNELKGKNTEWKLAMIAREGIVLDELPRWQKTGICFYYDTYSKLMTDLKTGGQYTIQKQTKQWTDEIDTEAKLSMRLEIVLTSIEETNRQKEKLWGQAY